MTDGYCSTALAPQTSPAEGVFIEMFITSALVLSVLMLATERHQATPFAPVGHHRLLYYPSVGPLFSSQVGIGLTLFSGHLCVVYVFNKFTLTNNYYLINQFRRVLYWCFNEHREVFWAGCRHWVS